MKNLFYVSIIVLMFTSFSVSAQRPMGIENRREVRNSATEAKCLNRCYKLPIYSPCGTPSTIMVKGRDMLTTRLTILGQAINTTKDVIYKYIFKELDANSSFLWNHPAADRFVAHWVIRDSMLYLRDDLMPRIDDDCLFINQDLRDPNFGNGNVWTYSDSLQNEINRLGIDIFKQYIPDRKTIRHRLEEYTGLCFDSRGLMPARWFTGVICAGSDFVSSGKSINQTKITVKNGRIVSVEYSGRPLARYDKPMVLDNYLTRKVTIWQKLKQAGITKPFRVLRNDEYYGVGLVYVDFTPMFTEDQIRLMLEVRDQVIKAFDDIDPKDITSDYLFIQSDTLRKDTDARWFARDPWVFPSERKVKTMTNFKTGFGY